MADVHVCTGGRRIPDEPRVCLDRTARIDIRHERDVRIGRHRVFRRKRAHLRHFLHTGTRRVGVEQADAKRALIQPLPHTVENAGHFRIRGDIIGPPALVRMPRHERQRKLRRHLVHHRDPRRDPVGGAAVVQRASGCRLVLVPGRHGQRAGFQFQRCRHAIERLHPVRRQRLAMRVQVDKSRRHDQAAGVDLVRARTRRLSDRGDAPPGDRDIGHRIEARFRIDHPAIANDEFKFRRHARGLLRQQSPSRAWIAPSANPTRTSRLRQPNRKDPWQ